MEDVGFAVWSPGAPNNWRCLKCTFEGEALQKRMMLKIMRQAVVCDIFCMPHKSCTPLLASHRLLAITCCFAKTVPCKFASESLILGQAAMMHPQKLSWRWLHFKSAESFSTQR